MRPFGCERAGTVVEHEQSASLVASCAHLQTQVSAAGVGDVDLALGALGPVAAPLPPAIGACSSPPPLVLTPLCCCFVLIVQRAS